MQTPTKDQIAKAREVVSHPELYCDIPSALQDAWEILKAARGTRVDYRGTGEPHYRIEQNAQATPIPRPVRAAQCPPPHRALSNGDDAA
jgi:hypothetical protein